MVRRRYSSNRRDPCRGGRAGSERLLGSSFRRLVQHASWNGGLPTSNDTATIANGGTAIVTQPGATCGTLSLGGNAGSGTIQMAMGSLAASAYENIGDSGAGNFMQSGGTNSVSSSLSIAMYGPGTYSISGGLLSAANETIGLNGDGTFMQSGGTNWVSSNLTVGYFGSYAATYSLGSLNGPSLLAAADEYIGDNGSGSFTQTGGTNSLSSGLYVGDGGFGTYQLQGGRLAAPAEYIGAGGIGAFTQTGGSNAAANVDINGGYYLLNRGLLLPASGGTLDVNNGGLQTAGGTFDCSAGSVTIVAGNSIVDLSKNVVHTVSASLSVGASSLLIVAPGFDPTKYAGYTNLGLTHTAGTTLNVSAGTGFGGWGTISDPVTCQGTIAATFGGAINLTNGLIIWRGTSRLGPGNLDHQRLQFGHERRIACGRLVDRRLVGHGQFYSIRRRQFGVHGVGFWLQPRRSWNLHAECQRPAFHHG